MNDSGTRRNFNTGAVRDAEDNKPMLELASPFVELRVGLWRKQGAEKYSPRNWEKGMPLSVYLGSAMRHLAKFRAGMDDEDHLSAVIWNFESLMHTQICIEKGWLPEELNDLPDYEKHGENYLDRLKEIDGVAETPVEDYKEVRGCTGSRSGEETPLEQSYRHFLEAIDDHQRISGCSHDEFPSSLLETGFINGSGDVYKPRVRDPKGFRVGALIYQDSDGEWHPMPVCPIQAVGEVVREDPDGYLTIMTLTEEDVLLEIPIMRDEDVLADCAAAVEAEALQNLQNDEDAEYDEILEYLEDMRSYDDTMAIIYSGHCVPPMTELQVEQEELREWREDLNRRWEGVMYEDDDHPVKEDLAYEYAELERAEQDLYLREDDEEADVEAFEQAVKGEVQ
jgi:hypothetical protein